MKRNLLAIVLLVVTAASLSSCGFISVTINGTCADTGCPSDDSDDDSDSTG